MDELISKLLHFVSLNWISWVDRFLLVDIKLLVLGAELSEFYNFSLAASWHYIGYILTFAVVLPWLLLLGRLYTHYGKPSIWVSISLYSGAMLQLMLAIPAYSFGKLIWVNFFVGLGQNPNLQAGLFYFYLSGVAVMLLTELLIGVIFKLYEYLRIKLR